MSTNALIEDEVVKEVYDDSDGFESEQEADYDDEEFKPQPEAKQLPQPAATTEGNNSWGNSQCLEYDS